MGLGFKALRLRDLGFGFWASGLGVVSGWLSCSFRGGGVLRVFRVRGLSLEGSGWECFRDFGVVARGPGMVFMGLCKRVLRGGA